MNLFCWWYCPFVITNGCKVGIYQLFYIKKLKRDLRICLDFGSSSCSLRYPLCRYSWIVAMIASFVLVLVPSMYWMKDYCKRRVVASLKISNLDLCYEFSYMMMKLLLLSFEEEVDMNNIFVYLTFVMIGVLA